jgi:hypothetical protein
LRNSELLTVWWKAFSIVTCTSLNVVQIANHNYIGAFFTGGLLSFVWWGNTKTAAHSTGKAARYAYALGAACGTLLGMIIGLYLA